jgi:hypothetical protein
MTKTLIAITGCRLHRGRADSQRRTWVKDVGCFADVRFFVGEPHTDVGPEDEVQLACPDDYVGRKQKIIRVFEWAMAQVYEYVWKVNDDVYLRPERLFSIMPHDYQRVITQQGTIFSGAIYGLSRQSVGLLLDKNMKIVGFGTV